MENLPDSRNQLNSKTLFEAFKTQLKKDFDQSNFLFDFAAAFVQDYDVIHERIMKALQHNENRTDFTVMRLLNRIDISEPQLKRYVAENKNEDRLHVLAELIIKRVLQKVVIKKFYKDKEDL